MLVNPDTEVYVAPRPRNAAPLKALPIPQLVSTVVGKGKEKAIEVRVVPQRIAAGWGRPQDDLAEEPVAWASSDTLELVRTKLGAKSGDVIPVRLGKKRGDKGQASAGTADSTAENGTAEERIVELWMAEWEEVPEGHIVLQNVETMEGDWAYVK